MIFEHRAFVLCLLFAAAQAWELPAFMLEDLPSMEEISAASSSSSIKVEGLSPGMLKEPHQRRGAEKNNGENTEAPTALPTESPAPSPSPSETPTEGPTATAEPTGQPTELPTESPAPSPSPSETPTQGPSDAPSSIPSAAPTISPMPTESPSAAPSSVPSDAPSVAPSSAPSISMMPSSAPSVAPSSVPSSVPTVSMMPSSAPSMAPSTSWMPSAMPTHLSSEAGSFTVNLPLEITLNETQTLAFETATMEFISNDIVVVTGDLSEAAVKVTSQNVVEIDKDDAEGRRRELMNFSELDIAQQLVVEFTAAAKYTGTDVEFDFAALLDHEFHSENPAWLRLLAQKDAIFDGIVPEEIKNVPEDGKASKNVIGVEVTSGKTGVSSGGVAAAAVLSISAMMIGVAAVVYSMKRHKETVYGRELDSTGGSSALMKSHSTSSGSRIARENQAEVQKRYDANDDDAVSWKADSEATPASPNSLEQGKSVSIKQIMKSSPKMTQQSIVGSGWDHIISAAGNSSSNSAGSRAKDPPSSSNVATSKPEARNMVSLFDNNTEMSELTNPTKPRTSENLQPANLTRNFFSNPITTSGYASDSTTGMQAIISKSASGFSTTDIPKISKSVDHASGMQKAPPTQEQLQQQQQQQHDPVPRYRSMEPKAEQIEERTTSELTPHAGLYDVFAPAGPIGIVVDTTKHGPAVHSLKRTSPMLGLINAGDLIVGLDDKDTRGMTAATLTRLMARKSSQKERKITLLTSETY